MCSFGLAIYRTRTVGYLVLTFEYYAMTMASRDQYMIHQRHRLEQIQRLARGFPATQPWPARCCRRRGKVPVFTSQSVSVPENHPFVRGRYRPL